jgi:mannan endo-1,4-beta-mannosidase
VPSWARAAGAALLHPGGWYLFVRVVTAGYAISALGRLVPVRRKQVAGYRRDPAGIAALTAAGTALACLAAVLAYGGLHGPPPPRGAEAADRSTPPLTFGVFEPDEWETWQPVDQFAAASGYNPDVVLLYSGWYEPWQAKFAALAYAHGAEPFIQIEPTGVTLQSIIDGRSDAYLRSYARSVRLFGHPVLLSFAAEMNGSWYSWGAGHVKPGTFIRAWRHVVKVFREADDVNARWLWTVNSTNASAEPLRPWWPGSRYVDLVGIDGYYYRPSDTFASVFGRTVNQIRAFTQLPILLSEVAVGPAAGAGRVQDLFAGIRRYHLLGLVWFDQAQHDGIYHQDWRLEDSPSSLAAVRKAMAAWSPAR